jgi:plastocyanin
MRKRMSSIALCAGVAVLLPASMASARATIPIKGIAFKRPSVTVHRGELVVWKDLDGYVTHSVTSRGEERFRSSPYLRAGDSHRVRFRRSGIYSYACRVHPVMTGRIVVE